MKIRKNDIVRLNEDQIVYGHVMAAGTELRVYRAKRDGTLSCSTLKREDGYRTIQVRDCMVMKVEKPLPVVKVGDIYVSNWGYDQTNVDYYQVMQVKSKTAVLNQIGSKRTYTGPMNGTCVPDTSVVGSKAIAKRILVLTDNEPYFKLTSYSSAYPWKGETNSFSEWA
jgi:hypothetical protein